ncbi:PREDICTED: uncharacterized protein LOC109483381 [Branchiostoma belcheri]|uniref:Uncharacterized protein LOC109483381 n=1 Tax=Branchiostoma belcheri TaxID=7741 RepID=A0A6P5A6Q5_BRABE|nr:PREDICTED: uncharacterized protein LOC109483381 [Branchiostoma belcheri]
MPLDTVLCLDTSGSMAGKGMLELRKAVRQFLTGVEQTATQTGLKENVAVVEFGGGVRIVQHLTNDYRRVQRAVDNLKPGGTTPMFEGLMEALKELVQNGGVLLLPGGIRMTPRVILMTDGRPDDKEKVILAAAAFSREGYQQVGLPYPVPIACVGCGSGVDVPLLAAIAAATNGMFAIGDVSEMSGFFLKQVLLIRFALQFAHDMNKLRNLILLRQFLQQMGENVSEEEAIALRALLLAMIVVAADDSDDDSPRVITAQPSASSRIVLTETTLLRDNSDRDEINHCMHCCISLFFPLWICVWCYLCCKEAEAQ